MSRHLVVDVSAHGFGHMAQAAAVINALDHHLPDLQVTIRTDLPDDLIAERVAGPYTRIQARLDPGMVMADALTVRPEATLQAYADFHTNWPERVAAEARELASLAPDLVLADVPYLSIAAAHHAGIPVVALCSLEWSGVLAAYCGHLSGTAAIRADIEAAYARAVAFLQPRPHMAMPYLPNCREIGPIATPAPGVPSELRARLPAAQRLGLVSLGGLPFDLPLAQWPRLADALWIVAGEAPDRADMLSLAATGMSHMAVMAAADVVVTKAGYATVVEAAVQGAGILYLPRGDWPEEPAMADWLGANARARAITQNELLEGDLGPALAELEAQSPPPRPRASGAEEAAAYLADLMP